MFAIRLKEFFFSLMVFASLSQTIFATWDRSDVIRRSKQPSKDRCDETISGQVCHKVNEWALQNQAITLGAYEWLEQNGWYVTQSFPGLAGSLCKCGCFHPETLIYVSDEGADYFYKSISSLKEGHSVLRLDGFSTIDKPNFEEAAIESLVSGFEPDPLYVFILENGHRLKVSSGHGMVLADGKMKAAKDVEEKDIFLSSAGDPVSILSISREKTQAKVINFDLGGSKYTDHIIVAEGVLVGELAFQNQYASILSEIDLRK